MFNADIWPEVKARAEGPARKYLDELLSKCDRMTDNPVAEGMGAHVRKDEKQSDGTKILLATAPIANIKEFGTQSAMCALAWRFTGNPKYLEKAKKMLKVSVAAYTEATNNRRPVNWYNTSRLNALCAYDWLYNDLTQEERAEIIIPLVEHVRLVQPETGLKIPRNSSGNVRTGYYGTYGLLWYSGLAAAGDGFCDSLARVHLEDGYRRLMEVVEYRNATAGDDGALSSAALNYSMGNYPHAHFNFFYSLRSAAGINIADRFPNMALFPYWVYWSWIRDAEHPNHMRAAGVGDYYHCLNYEKMEGMYEHFSNYMQFFGGSAPEATAFTTALREFSTTSSVSFKFPATPFLVDTEAKADPEIVEKIEHGPLKARHFETLGQVLMHSDWTPDATYCTYTAGAKVTQHKHYDENSFTIYHKDHLALDTGCRGRERDLNLSYYYCQSVAHNVILIHKPGEPRAPYWGPRADDPAANLNYGGQVNHTSAKVLAFETNDDYSYVASDATAAYGKKCTEAVRQFVYIHPDYFVVYDRVGSADPSYEKAWLLHTAQKPSVKKGVLRADSGEGRLFCQTLLPKNAKFELIGGPGREFWVRDRNYTFEDAVVKNYAAKVEKDGRGPYTGAWRLELKPGAPSADDRFLNVLTAADVYTAKPIAAKYVSDASRDGVVLTIDGRKITVWFNRTGEVGGSIAFGSGPETPLATSVTPQSGIIL